MDNEWNCGSTHDDCAINLRKDMLLHGCAVHGRHDSPIRHAYDHRDIPVQDERIPGSLGSRLVYGPCDPIQLVGVKFDASLPESLFRVMAELQFLLIQQGLERNAARFRMAGSAGSSRPWNRRDPPRRRYLPNYKPIIHWRRLPSQGQHPEFDPEFDPAPVPKSSTRSSAGRQF